MQEKSFVKCTLAFLDETFNLREVETLPHLVEWETVSAEVTATERIILENFQQGLRFNVHDWNEYELLAKFIGPIFGTISFSSWDYNWFGERDLEAKITTAKEEWRLFGKPDGFIASGRRLHKQPYFAFQEYKREKDPDGDPVGQVLAAMLVGRELNERKRPMYGCYVVGSNWYFLVLDGQNYAISAGYSALNNDLFLIINILKKLKEYIIHFVEEDKK